MDYWLDWSLIELEKCLFFLNESWTLPIFDFFGVLSPQTFQLHQKPLVMLIVILNLTWLRTWTFFVTKTVIFESELWSRVWCIAWTYIWFIWMHPYKLKLFVFWYFGLPVRLVPNWARKVFIFFKWKLNTDLVRQMMVTNLYDSYFPFKNGSYNLHYYAILEY